MTERAPDSQASKERASDESAAELRRDRGDLSRGVAVNLFGYLLKIGTPILTWVAIYCYGSRNFGLFVAGQATMMIAFRICVLGLDKGLWWWIPRQEPGRSFQVLGSVLVWVVSVGVVVSGGCFFGAQVLADWSREPESAVGLRWLAASVVPMAVLEILIAAAVGKRDMAAQVLIKDGFVPLSHLGIALLLYAAGMRVNGLPIAYGIARVLGVIGAFYFLWKKTDFQLADLRPTGLPRPLVVYSAPTWLGELGNSFVQRMDILAMSALTTPELVGAYGAVLQVGNTLKSLRQAFDPIVIVILSEISARADIRRLIASFSYTTALLLATQIPLYVFILLFATPLMGLLGQGYEFAANGVIVIAGFSLLNTVTGLHGYVVSAYGRSGLQLAGLVFTAGLQSVLLYALIPRYGLVGATLAVGIAYTPTNLAWVFVSRWLTGSSLYDDRFRPLLLLCAGSCAVAVASWFLLRGSGDVVARFGTALLYGVVYGIGITRLVRSGSLTGSRSSPDALPSPSA